MKQKKLESAKDLLDTLIGMVDDNHHSDYDGALKVGIECIERVQELEKENAELRYRLKIAHGLTELRGNGNG